MAPSPLPLVGRDQELAELCEALGVRPARLEPSPLPRAVLLSGDAGVGKTRLLTELRDVALGQGWQVFAGHCVDFGDSALPYLPFSEVIGRLSAELPDVVDSVARLHPGLVRLQPGRRVLGDEATDTAAVDRGDVFAAMHAVLGAAAEKAPLLLVVEDAHWADRSTRDMLSFLFSRPFDAPVAVVVSYRAEDLHRRHPLRAQVAEWSRIRGVERLHVGPLAPADVRALVRQLHPDPLAEAEVAGIVDRAEGNAFFVEELVGAAREAPGRVPEDLAQLLLVRLDRLDETAQRVVRVAAVAGRQVSHDLLVAAGGLSEAELDRGLRAAVESHVLVVAGDGGYAFRHALLAEAVYDDLLPGERVRLHAAYAEALREGRARGTAAELARHARQAMDLATALDASIRAGDEAMAVGGPDEAAHHYEHALELAADAQLATDVDVPQLVLRAAEALVAAGLPHRAHALLHRQLATLPGDTADEARALLHVHLAHTAMLFDNEVDWRAHAEAALALAPAEASTARAHVLGTYARVMAGHGRTEEARSAAMEALALAERLNLPSLASDATTTIVGLDRSVSIEDLSAALEDAARRASDSGAVNSEFRALWLLGRGYQDRGDLARAAETFERVLARARRAGLVWAPYALDSRFQRAHVAYVTGAWDDVLALTDLDGESPPPVAEAYLQSLRAVVLHGRGDPEGVELARRLRDFWSREGMVAIFSGPVLIDAHGAAGDPAGVVRTVDDLVATLSVTWREMFHARVRLAAEAIAALAAALPAMSSDDRTVYAGHAARLHGDGHRVLDFQREAGGLWGPEGQAWATRLDAELLRFRWLAGLEPPAYDELVAAWQETVARFGDFPHPFEQALSHVRLATVLRAAGDQAGARGAADTARALALRLGARPILAELAALVPTPSRPAPGTEALTPREREILALVAEGRTNGEIGRQLFISTKTVSVHVSNILGKLGAASRTEAAAVARRRGLLDA